MGLRVRCLVLVLVVVMNIHEIDTSQDTESHQLWGVIPSECTTMADELYDVTCPWTPPQQLPANETCEMFFKLPEIHYHRSVRFCVAISNWSRCPESMEPSRHACHFPWDATDVFNRCGPTIETRVNCSDGSVSTVRTLNREKIIVPKPVSMPTVVSVRSTEIQIKWKKYSGFDLVVYVIAYQQEYSSTIYNITTETTTATITKNLHYANAKTTIKVAAYFEENPLKLLSSWSQINTTTKMAAPSQKPENVHISKNEVDWENMERLINLSWDPIPEKFSGGPIERYIVQLKDQSDGGDPAHVTYNTDVSYCLLGVHPTHQYRIDVIAENPVGQSVPAVFLLPGLVNDRPLQTHYYFGIGLASLLTGLVLLTGFLALRKTMRATHLRLITFPVKTIKMNSTSLRKPTEKEKEVFDTLNSSDGSYFIKTEGLSACIVPEETPYFIKPEPTSNMITQLQKCKLITAEAMPFAKDADLCDGGGYAGEDDTSSATKPGLDGDCNRTDAPDELSEIQVDQVCQDKAEAWIDGCSNIKIDDGYEDGYRIDDGYSVQALASSDSGLSNCDQVDETRAYSLVSKMTTTTGYVKEARALSKSPSNHAAFTPYVPCPV